MRHVKFYHYELNYKSSDHRDAIPFTKIVDILNFVESNGLIDRRYRKNKNSKVLYLESFFESENPGYYYGCFCSIGHRYKQPLVRMDDLTPTNEMEDLQVVKNDGVRTRVYFAIYCDPTQPVTLMLQNVGTAFGISDFHDYVLCFFGAMRDDSFTDFVVERELDVQFDSKLKSMKRVSKIELECTKAIFGDFFSCIERSPDDFDDNVEIVISPKNDENLYNVCHDLYARYHDTRKYPHVSRMKFLGYDEKGDPISIDTEKPYRISVANLVVNGASGELFKEDVYEFFDELFS